MSFTPLPMTTDVRFSQFIKAAGPIEIATPMGESEMTSEATCEPRKAPAEMVSPTLRRALSKVTLARRISRKASLSTTAIEEGSVIEARDKPLKAFWPMAVSVGGRTTFESRSQPTNAFAPMPVTALLSSTVVSWNAKQSVPVEKTPVGTTGLNGGGFASTFLTYPAYWGAIPSSFSRIAFSSAMTSKPCTRKGTLELMPRASPVSVPVAPTSNSIVPLPLELWSCSTEPESDTTTVTTGTIAQLLLCPRAYRSSSDVARPSVVRPQSPFSKRSDDEYTYSSAELRAALLQ